MEKEVFKQSLLGFDRNQVIKYIDDLLKELKEKEIEYIKKQEELTNEIELLKASINQNETEFLKAKESAQILKEEIDKANKQNKELEEKLSKYREFIFLKEDAYNNLKLKYDEKDTEISKIIKENQHWKDRQEEISSTLVEARLKAKDIVLEAKEEANNIKLKFCEDANGLAKDFINVRSSIEDMEKQLEMSFTKVKNAINLIDKSSGDIQDKIINYSINIDDFGKDSRQYTYKKEGFKSKKEEKPTLIENILESISNLLEK